MDQVTELMNGYLNDVFAIFKARQHPFVLVEESALRWMGVRVIPEEDLDLLIKDSELEAIKADLLSTDRYQLVEQNLELRFSDTYTQQVPRLRLKIADNILYSCISLWSERVYMLSVDGEKIKVADPMAWNVVLMEERYDLHPSWAHTCSISYRTKKANGIRILPQIHAQTSDMEYPVFIPTIPRMLDALLDQARYRVAHGKELPGKLGNRPMYHLQNCVRYLHLEKPPQRDKVLSQLVQRNRGELMAIITKFKRKPPLAIRSSLQ